MIYASWYTSAVHDAEFMLQRWNDDREFVLQYTTGMGQLLRKDPELFDAHAILWCCRRFHAFDGRFRIAAIDTERQLLTVSAAGRSPDRGGQRPLKKLSGFYIPDIDKG